MLLGRYDRVHTALGIFGNVAFLIGSICFLDESTTTIGVWCFIVGAAGMVLGSIGETVATSNGDE